MDDYISRQKTLDEAQRIRRNLQVLDNTQVEDQMLYGVWRLEIEIEKLPAEPVREVVLCENCVKYERDITEADGWCNLIDIWTNPDDFCSCGEKKNDA